MKDIIFCSLPYSNLDYIYSAPAILKGVAQQNNFTATTVDFGVELSKLCSEDKALFYRIQNYFISPGNAELNQYELDILDQFFDLVVTYFKTNPSKFIGVSVFSRYTHKCSLMILDKLRRAGVTARVVVGGRGLGVPTLPTVIKDFDITTRESLMKFGDLLKHRKLVDEVIYGDGEDAILNVLSGTPIGTYDTRLESDSYMCAEPDYSDYNFKYYHFENGNIIMPITGSKGCVRDCDFCDIKNQFGKYRYRSGQDVANEMIKVSAEYNVSEFIFTDSLVNGGLRPFREFVEALAKFNLENPEKRITWSGQYICRPAEQMPADLYVRMAESGANGLTIGAESGSNKVLTAMNKKTTVEALYDEMEQFRRNGITCFLLIFVGHWSETYDDFVDQCRMLINLTPYARSGTISAVFLGTPFMINESVPVEVTRRINCAEVSGNLVWYMPENPTSTFKDRIYRRLLIGETCEKLQIPTKDNNTVFQYLSANLASYHKEINEFYREQRASPVSPSQTSFEHFDRFLQDLIIENEPEYHIKIKVRAQSSNGDPKFEVRVNDEVKYCEYLPTGEYDIEVSCSSSVTPISVDLVMSGKGPNDTQVNADGVIVADKNIQIDQFMINKFDLLTDYDFTRTYGEYETQNGDTEMKYGLWSNGMIRFKFDAPFGMWYNTRSRKNTKVSGALSTTDRSYDEEKALLMTQLKKLD